MQVVRGVCGWIRAAELAGSGRWGPPAGQCSCWAHRARALTALNSQQPLQVGSLRLGAAGEERPASSSKYRINPWM